jgi:hypothetical protein
MSRAQIYPANQINRHRATRAEVERRRSCLFEIVAELRPMTVRQVFYQATVRGFVDKSETGYRKVQTDLVQMRRTRALLYDWVADNTRWQRKPRTFSGVEEALRDTRQALPKALRDGADRYVEIWIEKDALAGVLFRITRDVPLMVARGYASLSFLHTAAEYIRDLDVPAYIYHLGDFDPSGVNAGEKIEETLRELAHLPPRFISSALPSPLNRSPRGICRPGRPLRRRNSSRRSKRPSSTGFLTRSGVLRGAPLSRRVGHDAL